MTVSVSPLLLSLPFSLRQTILLRNHHVKDCPCFVFQYALSSRSKSGLSSLMTWLDPKVGIVDFSENVSPHIPAFVHTVLTFARETGSVALLFEFSHRASRLGACRTRGNGVDRPHAPGRVGRSTASSLVGSFGVLCAQLLTPRSIVIR